MGADPSALRARKKMEEIAREAAAKAIKPEVVEAPAVAPAPEKPPKKEKVVEVKKAKAKKKK